MPEGGVFYEFKGWTYRLAVEEGLNRTGYRASLSFWPPGQNPTPYTALALVGPMCDTADEARASGVVSAEGWITRQLVGDP